MSAAASLWRLRLMLNLLLRGSLAGCLLCGPALAQGGVAVWDFDHHGLDGPQASALAPVSRALSELLIEALLAQPGLQVVERSRLREILDEQKLGSSALADGDTRLRLGRLAGAKHMVFGSLVQIGDMARLDVRLVAVATTEVLAAQEISGPLQELGEGLQGAAQLFASRLGGVSGMGASASPGGASGGASVATLTRFDAALALMDRKDYAAALDALQALLRTDPDFAPAERHIPIVLEKLARQ